MAERAHEVYRTSGLASNNVHITALHALVDEEPRERQVSRGLACTHMQDATGIQRAGTPGGSIIRTETSTLL